MMNHAVYISSLSFGPLDPKHWAKEQQNDVENR
jgi:hypothetical protein